MENGQNLNGVHVLNVLVGYTAGFGLHHMVSMGVSRGLRVMMTAPKAQGVGLIQLPVGLAFRRRKVFGPPTTCLVVIWRGDEGKTLIAFSRPNFFFLPLWVN